MICEEIFCYGEFPPDFNLFLSDHTQWKGRDRGSLLPGVSGQWVTKLPAWPNLTKQRGATFSGFQQLLLLQCNSFWDQQAFYGQEREPGRGREGAKLQAAW